MILDYTFKKYKDRYYLHNTGSVAISYTLELLDITAEEEDPVYILISSGDVLTENKEIILKVDGFYKLTLKQENKTDVIDIKHYLYLQSQLISNTLKILCTKDDFDCPGCTDCNESEKTQQALFNQLLGYQFLAKPYAENYLVYNALFERFLNEALNQNKKYLSTKVYQDLNEQLATGRVQATSETLGIFASIYICAFYYFEKMLAVDEAEKAHVSAKFNWPLTSDCMGKFIPFTNMEEIFLEVADLCPPLDEFLTRDEILDRLLRMEASITVNAQQIALKVSQTQFDEFGAILEQHSASLAVTAKQITLLVTRAEFDALGERVSLAETAITQTAYQITLKASHESVNELTGRLQRAESLIIQTAEQISMEVSREEVDDLLGRVITAESLVMQTADAISSMVTRTEFDAFTGDINTKFSQVEQTAESITSSVSLLNQKVETLPTAADVEAAKNAAKTHADTLNAAVKGDITDITNQLDTLDQYLDGAFADGVIETAEAAAIEKYIQNLDKEKRDIDNRYTAVISEVLLSGSALNNLISSKGTYNATHTSLIAAINLAIADKKTTAAEKTAVDNAFTPYKNALADLSTKFEQAINFIAQAKANKAVSDYETNVGGPRYESYQTFVTQTASTISLLATKATTDALGNRLGLAEASITVQAEQIALRVTNETFNALGGRVATAEASISVQAGQIASKVESSTFNALGERVTAAESSVTQLANSITSRISESLGPITGRLDGLDGSIASLNGSMADKVTRTEHNSAITQLSNSITSKVSLDTFNALGTRMGNAESTISQQATAITSKVSSTDFNGNTLVSLINQTAGAVKISAALIDLDGAVKAWSVETPGYGPTFNKNGDNALKFYHSNGVLGMEIGIIAGKLTLIWYNESGQEVWRGGNSGIIYVNNVPESWTPMPFALVTSDLNHTATSLKNLITTSTSMWNMSVCGEDYDGPMGINRTLMSYSYYAGINAEASANKPYEGYKTASGSKTSNIPNGWYTYGDYYFFETSPLHYDFQVHKIINGNIVETVNLSDVRLNVETACYWPGA